jgi:hypothetical protein
MRVPRTTLPFACSSLTDHCDIRGHAVWVGHKVAFGNFRVTAPASGALPDQPRHRADAAGRRRLRYAGRFSLYPEPDGTSEKLDRGRETPRSRRREIDG